MHVSKIFESVFSLTTNEKEVCKLGVLIIGGKLNYLEVRLCNAEQAFRLEKHIWDKEGAFVSTEHSPLDDSICIH